MNTVIKSQNQKQAAIDFATAKETEADGVRRAAEKYFKGNAIELKKLESVVSSLQQGTNQ